MAELKGRAKKFFRRSSQQHSITTLPASETNTTTSSAALPDVPVPPITPRSTPLKRLRPSWSRSSSYNNNNPPSLPPNPEPELREISLPGPDDRKKDTRQADDIVAPVLTLQQPSPDKPDAPVPQTQDYLSSVLHIAEPLTPDSTSVSPFAHPAVARLSSPTSGAETPPTTVLLDDRCTCTEEIEDYFTPVPVAAQKPASPQEQSLPRQPAVGSEAMARRKIWIKRAGASPTSVQITEEDLVDDVRDMVLRKYANSLGRKWDAPDVTIRIIPRERSQVERVLAPDEPICRVVEAYFPGGQGVEEALLIDVPRRRTPLPSPRMPAYGHDEDAGRPLENGGDYFPPMPAASPHPSHSGAETRQSLPQQHPSMPHSISVLETGQLPPLHSPSIRERKSHHRPKNIRQHTSSPTILTASNPAIASGPQQYAVRQSFVRSNTSHPTRNGAPPPAPPLLPPGTPLHEATRETNSKATSPTLENTASPRTTKRRQNRNKASISLAAEPRRPEFEQRRPSHAQVKTMSTIEATVPPINVLIVEDNPINLKVLEMFTRRLKVRWSSVMNGRDAVDKWRSGGFHLVLMDIQLPIMNGLEATKEIRRLERVNGIGVFAKGDAEASGFASAESPQQKERKNSISDGSAAELVVNRADKLSTDGLFKSPVIIVALTASSLQSDRHEALAAGCNDFLTKPVHFPWLERKVMEWGCMQALIDFDGWRKWKDLAAAAELQQLKDEDKDPAAREKREKKEAKRAALLAKMSQQQK